MNCWNFDMEAAPHGKLVTVKRTIGKNVVETEQYQPDTIFAAGADGVTVTPTRWIPKEGRWSMFTKDAPPIAWMPWPAHPHSASEVSL